MPRESVSPTGSSGIQSGAVYHEAFDQGPGGWAAWDAINGIPADLEPEIRNSCLTTRSPWGIDPNHAPPGLGYLHILAVLPTSAATAQRRFPQDRQNRFVEGGHSRDMTGARLEVRLRGELNAKGAELLLLIQADIPGTRANLLLTGRPISVHPTWTNEVLHLDPSPDLWRCLGARHDLQQAYGCGEASEVLRDVNVDINLVLFPLDIVPKPPRNDPHDLIPERDYEVDRSALPEGWIEIDDIGIDYGPSGGS